MESRKNGTEEPICREGMETWMWRMDLWTQWGQEKVGQIGKVALRYIDYVLSRWVVSNSL